jgi:hypothetical protein
MNSNLLRQIQQQVASGELPAAEVIRAVERGSGQMYAGFGLVQWQDAVGAFIPHARWVGIIATEFYQSRDWLNTSSPRTTMSNIRTAINGHPAFADLRVESDKFTWDLAVANTIDQPAWDRVVQTATYLSRDWWTGHAPTSDEAVQRCRDHVKRADDLRWLLPSTPRPETGLSA